MLGAFFLGHPYLAQGAPGAVLYAPVAIALPASRTIQQITIPRAKFSPIASLGFSAGIMSAALDREQSANQGRSSALRSVFGPDIAPRNPHLDDFSRGNDY
jgi:hypothetical protein